MTQVELEAKPRTVIGKGVRRLRREGILPAVIYGSEIEPTPIELNAHDATNTLLGVSGSTLIDLKVDGDTHKVLLREIQVDTIRRDLQHVDFLRVSMDASIRTVVPVELIGSAPAAKEKGGVLVTGLDEIEIEALPQDLPERFEVDVSILKEIDDSIVVGDLTLPAGVEVLDDPDELIARVIYQAEEVVEEEEELEGFVSLEAEPELVDRGKRREDEDEEEDEEEEE